MRRERSRKEGGATTFDTSLLGKVFGRELDDVGWVLVNHLLCELQGVRKEGRRDIKEGRKDIKEGRKGDADREAHFKAMPAENAR
jgi:hypothetical protein